MEKHFRNQQKQSEQKSRAGILTENKLNCIRIEKTNAKSKIKEEDCTELSKKSHERMDVSSSFTASDSVSGMSVKARRSSISSELADSTFNQSCNSDSEHKGDIKECHMVSEELLALNKRIEELKKRNCKYSNQISRLNRFESLENQIMGTWKEESKRGPVYGRNVYNKKLAELVEQFYLDVDHSRPSADEMKYIIENGNKQKIRYLLYKTEILYDRFVANFPQHQNISYTKFCKLKPFWVLPRLKKNMEML